MTEGGITTEAIDLTQVVNVIHDTNNILLLITVFLFFISFPVIKGVVDKWFKL